MRSNHPKPEHNHPIINFVHFLCELLPGEEMGGEPGEEMGWEPDYKF